MSEPTTRAGRALLKRLGRDQLWHPVDGRRDEMEHAVAAIEAEAVAAARTALLDELETWVDVFDDFDDDGCMPKDAVREWINRRRP